MLRFKELYEKEAVSNLVKEFNYKNRMQVPKLLSVHLNMGIGKAIADKKYIESAVQDLTKIAGQKPVVTKAKQSIATFKLREDMPIGAKVTLRKDKMFEFLERLILVALPRSREFRGFSKRSFDGNGNFSLGIKEHIVFPEIDYDKILQVWGLDITVKTSAKTDVEAKSLLSQFHFPFVN